MNALRARAAQGPDRCASGDALGVPGAHGPSALSSDDSQDDEPDHESLDLQPASTASGKMRPRGSRRSKRLGLVGPSVGPAVLVLVAWELVVRLAHVRLQILPAPSVIVRSGMADLPDLLAATKVTAAEVALGLGVAIAVGVLGAYLLWLLPRFGRAASPLLVMSQTVPMIAIAPLMVIWFGFDATAKVLLVALFGFFPIIIALSRGLSAPNQEQVDVAATLGASKWWILLHLRTPAAARQLMSGLRIAVTYAPATAATAEFVGARQGLGIYLLSAQASFHTDLVFVGAFALTVMTLLLYLAVAGCERLLVPWQRAVQS